MIAEDILSRVAVELTTRDRNIPTPASLYTPNVRQQTTHIGSETCLVNRGTNKQTQRITIECTPDACQPRGGEGVCAIEIQADAVDENLQVKDNNQSCGQLFQ
jgi:hypothetical protein